MQARLLTTAFLLAVALTAGGVARAQDATGAGEVLFQEAKKLEADHKYSEACPKFLASYNLSRKLGTLLNLAVCYEKNGQIASAWTRYREEEARARKAAEEKAGDPREADKETERANFAKEHADALAGRLSRLTIAVAATTPDLQVKRDGILVDSSLFGLAVPIDAGEHAIEVSAPGKKPWATTAKVEGEGASVTVTVPALEDEAVVPPPVAQQPAPAAPAPGAIVVPPGQMLMVVPKPPNGKDVAMIVAGSFGAGGVVLGSVFALIAKSSYDQAGCQGTVCAKQYQVDETDSARSLANVATVSFIVGGVAAAVTVGIWLWVPAPKDDSPGVKATIGPDGVMLRGSF